MSHGLAGLACRASCSGSAGYVTRAVCVVSAITIIVNQLITNCLNQEPTPNPPLSGAGGDPFCSTFLPSLSFRVLHAVYRSSALCPAPCALCLNPPPPLRGGDSSNTTFAKASW